jgi:hypothetical protein
MIKLIGPREQIDRQLREKLAAAQAKRDEYEVQVLDLSAENMDMLNTLSRVTRERNAARTEVNNMYCELSKLLAKYQPAVKGVTCRACGGAIESTRPRCSTCRRCDRGGAEKANTPKLPVYWMHKGLVGGSFRSIAVRTVPETPYDFPIHIIGEYTSMPGYAKDMMVISEIHDAVLEIVPATVY